MTSRTIIIEPRDPLIFRDPRPAEAGLPIRSLDWPLPSAMIGAIRTRLGRRIGFDAVTIDRLKRIEHVGPIPAIPSDSGWQLCFPAPADAVLFEGKSVKGNPGFDICMLRPRKLRDNEGTNLDRELFPLFGAQE